MSRSVVSLNTNAASVSVQRRFAENSRQLQESLSRLCSGLRINKAADDAAGLAIAQSLNVDGRVMSQGLRNLNDAVSMLNIAEGALGELSAISLRQLELAEQAANEVLELTQRKALHAEANALVDEYNRIVGSAEFNGQKLFDPAAQAIRSQFGYGESFLALDLGAGLERDAGDGTFSRGAFLSTFGTSMQAADVNGDGREDVVSIINGSNTGSVYLGNGDGTFGAAINFSTGGVDNNNYTDFVLADFNEDEKLDLLVLNSEQAVPAPDTVTMLFGTGDGDFLHHATYATGSNDLVSAAHADFDGDGHEDVVIGANGGNALVMFGSGDGSFRSQVNLGAGYAVAVGDLNNDGRPDIATGITHLRTFSYAGDDKFTAMSALSLPSSIYTDMEIADINNDGFADIAAVDLAAGGKGLSVYLGQGDGIYNTSTRYTTAVAGNTLLLTGGDFTSDGQLDFLVRTSANAAQVYVGEGDGTFSAATAPAEFYGGPVGTADFDNDGVLDCVRRNTALNGVDIALGNSTRTSEMPHLYLLSAEGARGEIETLRSTLERVNTELSMVGSMQSRAASACNSVLAGRDAYRAAQSQIMDADIARESAEAIKGQMLQQAAAAVLLQANSSPQLALRLLALR